MYGYRAFYQGKQIEVRAESSYKAQCEAARVLKVPDKKRYQITVVLCERPDGSTVTHSPAEI